MKGQRELDEDQSVVMGLGLINIHLITFVVCSQIFLILYPHSISYPITSVICSSPLGSPWQPLCQITKAPTWLNAMGFLKITEIGRIKIMNKVMHCSKGSR